MPITVAASSSHVATPVANAIDGNTSTAWATNSTPTGWIRLDMGASTQIASYKIGRENGAPARTPTAWTFEGTDDGTFASWTTLDTKSGQTWTTAGEFRNYTLPTHPTYRYYRLNITAVGSGSFAGLSEFEVVEPVVVLLASPTVHGSWIGPAPEPLQSLVSLTVHGSAMVLTEGVEVVPDGATLASRTVHASAVRLILAPAAVPVVLTEWPVKRQAHVMAALSAANPRYTPHVDYDVETGVVGRLHVWVDGQDVTFLRGSPTIVGECVQSVPLGDDRAAIEFPQVKPWDIPGTDDLSPLRPDAPVEVALIRPDHSRTVLFEGFTSSFSDYSGDGRETYTVECEGTLAQAMHEPHDPPLFLEPTDVGVLIARALNKVTNRRYGAIPETTTGILSTNRGSQNQSVWQYVQDLLSVAWSDDGRQWTLRRVAPGTFRLVLKPTTATVHWTVTKGAHGVTVDLIHDESTRRDAVYGRGVDTDGGVWANWFYPFLDEFLPPRYPFNNPATSVSTGTTDGDTDTGNGVTLWQRRMREIGFAVAVDGVMNGNDTAWVKAVQRKRGITADGVLGPQTWTATFDPGPLEVDLTAIRRPLATKPEVEPWLYAANGARSARNPAHDARIIRHAMPDVFMGTGVRKTTQGYAMADAILTREGTVGAAGRIVLTTDPHEAGASRLDIQVGDNIEVVGHRGSTVVQVAEVAHGSLSSTLTVDERARDALSVEAILERNRQARTSTANRGGNYKSSELDRADVVQYESESKAGTVPRIAVNGNSGLWSVIPIFVSQVGVAKAVLTATSPKAEIVCAIFGRPITANKLASFLSDPLASSDGWYDNVDTLRESYGLMDIWGTPDQPGGYFPRQKTGDPVGPLTGRLEERSGVLYDSQYGGVVWVALFTSRSTWVSGRIFPAVQGN